MEGQALGRVDAERDHSRGRYRSTSTLASASPAILCGKEGRTLQQFFKLGLKVVLGTVRTVRLTLLIGVGTVAGLSGHVGGSCPLSRVRVYVKLSQAVESRLKRKRFRGGSFYALRVVFAVNVDSERRCA